MALEKAIPKGGAGIWRARQSNFPKASRMNIHISLAPLLSLIAGILILIIPSLLNYIVAIYLIIIGLVGLFGLHI
jgi:hypothetical protein